LRTAARFVAAAVGRGLRSRHAVRHGQQQGAQEVGGDAGGGALVQLGEPATDDRSYTTSRDTTFNGATTAEFGPERAESLQTLRAGRF
jgi:hypothetical protein